MSAADRRRAVRCAASAAEDAADLWLLLDVLGLTAVEGKTTVEGKSAAGAETSPAPDAHPVAPPAPELVRALTVTVLSDLGVAVSGRTR
ncbi:hypothetical protein L6E12_17020 [Actinokineospora sp. PR83]|uniref:hypothetical protein n=1 Tax=Actinokineospora sp. PR83 TaxID=2884908 RepID=UPI001F200D0F|nr:hypothetical protein [Actinokineospora sp. PR83]MCG8917489.1 hypothetical protein [Actinokineospora sp. PR83]